MDYMIDKQEHPYLYNIYVNSKNGQMTMGWDVQLKQIDNTYGKDSKLELWRPNPDTKTYGLNWLF